MTPSPSENRFDALFVRYWDDRLTPEEMAEFTKLLEAEPLARDWFRMYSLQAVAAADRPVPVLTAPGGNRGWSRRRVMQYLGGGLAVGVVATVAGRQYLPFTNPTVEITTARGGVTVTTASGRPLPPVGPLPSDVTVTTHGTGSSALLAFPNGSDVLLAGDTSVTLTGDSRQLRVARGSAVADIRPTRAGEREISFHTPEAVVSAIGGTLLTLTHMTWATEVGVQTGQAAVSAPSGEPIDHVRHGELFTVRPGGRHSKQLLNESGGNYTLDLTEPLPDGWFVGKRKLEAYGPVIRPEIWFDPYHQSEMFQIRSHNRWARGLCRLHADSEVNVRYRVQRSGRGQVCLVSRSEKLKDSATGVLEWNGRYEPADWQTITVRADEMLDNREAPKFGPPWVAFLLIFNTYGADLGLEVAEFRVSRPGGRFEG